MRVYLCGPINGCADDEACAWREWFKSIARASATFVRCPEWIDPMDRDYRGKEHGGYREIVELDKRDVLSCDIVLVMFMKPSVGTSMEILFAWENGIPVLLIDESNMALSPWLRYHVAAIVNSKEAAVDKLIEWMR